MVHTSGTLTIPLPTVALLIESLARLHNYRIDEHDGALLSVQSKSVEVGESAALWCGSRAIRGRQPPAEPPVEQPPLAELGRNGGAFC